MGLIRRVRHSTVFLLVVYLMPMLLIAWQAVLISWSFLQVLADLHATGQHNPDAEWMIINGANFSPIITSLLAGVMASVVSTRRLMMFWNVVTAIVCVCAMASSDLPVLVIAQLVFGFYAGNSVACMLIYLSIATSVVHRSLVMFAGYFCINSAFPALVSGIQVALARTGQGRAPTSALSCGVMFGGLVLSSLLFLLLPERPLEFALGELVAHHNEHVTVTAGSATVGGSSSGAGTPISPSGSAGTGGGASDAGSESFSRLSDASRKRGTRLETVRRVVQRMLSRQGVTWRQVLAVSAHFLLINAGMFGFQVFSTLLQSSLLTLPDPDDQLFVALAMLGVAAVTLLVLLPLLRSGWVPDRVLLLASGAALIVGYALEIHWGTPSLSARQQLAGAVLITVADNVVIALGTSLFTKLVQPALLAVWIGVMIATNSAAQLLGAIMALTDADSSFIATLVLVALSLALMLPVYRYLVPSLYSPWSGGALPLPTEGAAAAELAASAELGVVSPGAWRAEESTALLTMKSGASSVRGGPVVSPAVTPDGRASTTSAAVVNYHTLD